MTAPYFVHGVELVNCGGEMCEACGERQAVGRSLKAHAICARCAGHAATDADEYAREREAAQARREAKMGTAVTMEPTPAKGHSPAQKRRLTHHNTQRSESARETRVHLVMTALRDAGEPLCVSALVQRTRISEHTVRLALEELVEQKRLTVTAEKWRSGQRLLYALVG